MRFLLGGVRDLSGSIVKCYKHEFLSGYMFVLCKFVLVISIYFFYICLPSLIKYVSRSLSSVLETFHVPFLLYMTILTIF